jgi:hypothetical protein
MREKLVVNRFTLDDPDLDLLDLDLSEDEPEESEEQRSERWQVAPTAIILR